MIKVHAKYEACSVSAIRRLNVAKENRTVRNLQFEELSLVGEESIRNLFDAVSVQVSRNT